MNNTESSSESMLESREKNCRYCVNECDKNFSVCQCNGYLCNKCLTKEFTMTIDKGEGSQCTVCKIQYIMEYKKCTCYSIFTSCKNNTIARYRTSIDISKEDTFGMVLMVAWSIIISCLHVDNEDMIIFFIIADTVITLIIMLTRVGGIPSQLYINSVLIYLILYTTKIILLIQFNYNSTTTLMISFLNFIIIIYFLIRYTFICNRIYNEHRHDKENVIIKAK